MKHDIKLYLLLIFSLGISMNIYADEIELNNGDRISGLIINLQHDILVLNSPVVGKLEIPVNSIAAFSTNDPISIVFKNNDQLTGIVEMQGNGLLQLQTERLGTIDNIAISDLDSAYQSNTKSSLSPSETKTQTSIEVINTKSVLKTDEVLLNSGDRLLGIIQNVDEKHLVIQTEFADMLKIERQNIKSFTTKEPMTVVFDDHDYITGRITKSDQSHLQIDTDRAGMSNEFELSEVKEVVRGDPVKIAREKEKVKLRGDVDIGLSTSSGNSNDDSYIGAGELRARTPNNRYTIRVEKAFERSDGDKTKDETFGSIQYDHFLSEKWYLFNSASFEEDEIELLNLRTALSAGAGYQFFERDDLLLSAELGPSYVNEDFEDESDNDYLAARWAIDYEHEIFEWMSIFHHQEGLYGLESSDDVVIRARNGLKFPLGNGFNAKAQANYEWDKSPAEGAASTDKEYIFTLGYGF